MKQPRLAADVQHYLNDEAVVACPPSTAYRFKKFARRNRTALATSTLIALALIAGTTVSVWQAMEANNARQLADKRWRSEQQAHRDADANFQFARQGRGGVDQQSGGRPRSRTVRFP